MIALEVVQKILQQYGLKPQRIAPAQTGYRSQVFTVTLPGHIKANFIVYKREPDIVVTIRNANRLGVSAASSGLPARHPLDSRIMRLKGTGGESYGALYNYLPGSTIPWEGYTMEHIKQLGGTLGQLHTAFAREERGELPSVINLYLQIVERMTRYYTDAGVTQALYKKLLLLPPDLSPYSDLLTSYLTTPAQPLHMDFVRGNILFNPATKQLTGILDFEKAAWGPANFDLARTLAFLLVDCKYKPAAKVRKYFLQSGYGKRGQQTAPQDPAFEQLVTLFLLYDFYKFLRHNPYESLHNNEHYCRTHDLLVQQGALIIAPSANT